MSGANVIVRKLLDTGSDTAIGIGHVLQALLSAAQSSGKMPITVEHTDRGTTRMMMFSRQTLSTPFHIAVEIIKSDFGLGYNITITGALFYNEDGSVQLTPVEVSRRSWSDLVAHVHTIFIRKSSN